MKKINLTPLIRNRLSKDIIVAAALRILEREGFGGLSMRQLAARLGVSATAIYHHIPSRIALLDLCAESALRQIPEPDRTWDWKRRLKALIIDQQRTSLKYPGLARYLVSYRDTSAASMRWIESILDVMCLGGFDGSAAIRVLIAMSFILNPMTFVEEVPHKRRTTMMNKTWAGKVLAKNPGKFPRATALLPLIGEFEGGGYFYESHFELALDRMIAGIASDLAGPGSGKRKALV